MGTEPPGTNGTVEAGHLPVRAERPLTPRQLRAVDLLLDGHGSGQVAATLGIHRQRISEWMRKAAFKAELEARREALRRGLHASLPEAAKEAVGYLRRVVSGCDFNRSERIAAAKTLLGLAARVLPKIADVPEEEKPLPLGVQILLAKMEERRRAGETE